MLLLEDAQTTILSYGKSFGTDHISIELASGRVLAENIYADRYYPPFNRSAMDGYAIHSSNWNSGIREFCVIEEIYAGQASEKILQVGSCYKIMTGASVPHSADVVIRVEDALQQGTKVSFLVDTIKPFQNISRKGEDIKQNEEILAKGTFLNALSISALAVMGRSTIKVQKLPSIALISTGNEVVSINSTPSEVEIRDSNSYAIVAFLQKYQIPVSFRKLVPDDKSILANTLSQALQHSITIISGGVSAGDADFVPEILARLGVKKVFHKVQIKPGKPIWFGISSEGNIVFALPGNPISVQVGFKLFIEPFLRACFGLSQIPILKLPLSLSKSKKSSLDEFFPCKIQNLPVSSLTAVKFNGSGDVTSILLSEGIGHHPRDKKVIDEGEPIEFIFW